MPAATNVRRVWLLPPMSEVSQPMYAFETTPQLHAWCMNVYLNSVYTTLPNCNGCIDAGQAVVQHCLMNSITHSG